MAQLAWPAFTQLRHDLHLVVVHAPPSICEDPAALMKVLIERLQLEGDFAFSCEEARSETILFCAFARTSDADVIIDALCAHENNLHRGWATEFHCSIDKAIVDAVGLKPPL